MKNINISMYTLLFAVFFSCSKHNTISNVNENKLRNAVNAIKTNKNIFNCNRLLEMNNSFKSKHDPKLERYSELFLNQHQNQFKNNFIDKLNNKIYEIDNNKKSIKSNYSVITNQIDFLLNIFEIGTSENLNEEFETRKERDLKKIQEIKEILHNIPGKIENKKSRGTALDGLLKIKNDYGLYIPEITALELYIKHLIEAQVAEPQYLKMFYNQQKNSKFKRLKYAAKKGWDKGWDKTELNNFYEKYDDFESEDLDIPEIYDIKDWISKIKTRLLYELQDLLSFYIMQKDLNLVKKFCLNGINAESHHLQIARSIRAFRIFNFLEKKFINSLNIEPTIFKKLKDNSNDEKLIEIRKYIKDTREHAGILAKKTIKKIANGIYTAKRKTDKGDLYYVIERIDNSTKFRRLGTLNNDAGSIGFKEMKTMLLKFAKNQGCDVYSFEKKYDIKNSPLYVAYISKDELTKEAIDNKYVRPSRVMEVTVSIDPNSYFTSNMGIHKNPGYDDKKYRHASGPLHAFSALAAIKVQQDSGNIIPEYMITNPTKNMVDIMNKHIIKHKELAWYKAPWERTYTYKNSTSPMPLKYRKLGENIKPEEITIEIKGSDIKTKPPYFYANAGILQGKYNSTSAIWLPMLATHVEFENVSSNSAE